VIFKETLDADEIGDRKKLALAAETAIRKTFVL
jgi:hypothetical protein